MEGTILVATAGQGVLSSADDGRTWYRISTGQDIEFDAVVRCLAVDSRDPRVIYAGADAGLARSDDAGVTWHRVDSPMNGMQVWSLAVDPDDPARMLAGTGAPSRAAVFRTTDNGKNWTACPRRFPSSVPGSAGRAF